jgi:hypothetical protein
MTIVSQKVESSIWEALEEFESLSPNFQIFTTCAGRKKMQSTEVGDVNKNTGSTTSNQRSDDHYT